jgi:hypothetical protein
MKDKAKTQPFTAPAAPDPVMGATPQLVVAYAHPDTRRTVVHHDAGHAFTATGIYAGPAQEGAEIISPTETQPEK